MSIFDLTNETSTNKTIISISVLNKSAPLHITESKLSLAGNWINKYSSLTLSGIILF